MMIEIPTTIHGERVVCAFPIIGGQEHDLFVEAEVVTTNERGVYRVARFRARGATDVLVGTATTSFPEAIRTARKRAGWG